MSAVEDQLLLDRVLSSEISIPPQPAILLEIERLLTKSGDQLAALGRLIGKDAGLSAAIFKMVNSPFYRRAFEVDNTQQAVTILGTQQVINLVKGLALRRVLSGHEMAYTAFWERSEEIAVISAIIAGRQVAVCNISMDQAYMAGLFHECGVPLLMQRFRDYCRIFRLNESGHWPDFREEDKQFRTDHMVAGYLVARHWNLPDFICQAVRFHHDRLSVDYTALTMVSILQIAHHLHKKIHHVVDNEWPLIREFVLDEIGVHLDSEDEFLEEILDRFNQIT